MRLQRIVLAVIVAALAGGSTAQLSSQAADPVEVQILAINDLHGTLDPPGGGSGRVGSVEVGGMEFLATHLARLRAGHPHSLTVSAGDNIGASPLMSGLFHDEPTIAALNAAHLDLSAVGNHELDEGWAELARMQRGGCHPADGCHGLERFGGASFQYLAANIGVDPARATPPDRLASFVVREFDGVKVGFIGLTLRHAPEALMPSTMQGLSFEDEASTANVLARQLRSRGVGTIVILIHEGGRGRQNAADVCGTMSGEIVNIASRLSHDVDLVVSGHTHRAYACTMNRILVTSADSYGRMITDIELRIDRRTGRVTTRSAVNVLVTRDVNPDGAVVAAIAPYRALIAKEALRQVGSITDVISRRRNAAGESPLGELVADGMLEATSAPQNGGATIAFMNGGGIRTDLTHAEGAGGGPVTYADLYRVLPFGNHLLVKTLTGNAIRRLLEQQFDNPYDGTDSVLQVSEGFSYSYRRSRPVGHRVDEQSMRLNGSPLDPRGRYRVVMPDFLWEGGDRFSVALEGTDVTPSMADHDAMSTYVQRRSPISPPAPDRIRREP